MFDVAVVGSLNLDTTVRVPHLPVPGETVLGGGTLTDTGGKGANQAVAAARLGRRVAMVGAVGDDAAAALLREALAAAGVDVSHLVVADLPTGSAFIAVDDAGENMIVVDPGANGVLGPDHLPLDVLASATVTLLQHEIPAATVAAAVQGAGGTVILNPAPGRAVGGEVLAAVDVLVPNATELAVLAGGAPPASPDEAAAMAASLDGPAAVVVTLGAAGALVLEGGEATLVPAPVVEAVDPTAAGDAFCGGLADALVGGARLVEATRWAVRVGAVTATRPGAQSSLPTREEVDAMEGDA
jgi:ribokinase